MKLRFLTRCTCALSLLATQCDQGTLVIGGEPTHPLEGEQNGNDEEPLAPTNDTTASASGADEPSPSLPASAAGEEEPSVDEGPDVEEGIDEPAEPAEPPSVGPYPAGPYAEANPAEGSIVENLAFRGMLNLTGEPTANLEPQDYTLQDLRETGASHALFLVAASWCPSCQIAAGDLAQGLAGDVNQARAAGGLVVDLLNENGARQPATDGELLNWALRFNMTVSLLTPADERVVQVFATREIGYVVELQTMQVVHNTGFQFFTTPTVAEVGMDGLLESLGL